MLIVEEHFVADLWLEVSFWTMSQSPPGKFIELWEGVSKLCDGKTKATKQQMAATETSAIKGFQSPRGRRCTSRLSLVHGDSPGDVEPSQDIVWDCTSPNAGPRNNRAVEISDIVNRIAPKEGKQQRSSNSPLQRWIGDSAFSSTPDVPKPRARRKFSRQNSVEDLLKLARQFDENMQQDRETERQQTPSFSTAEDRKGSTWSDGVEAELHALFDSSTQKISGQLSQGFSQEARIQATAELSERSEAAPPAAEDGGSIRSVAPHFDDDWEDDNLLNDPELIAMTQDPLQEQLGVRTQADPATTLSGSSSVVPPSASRLRPSLSDSNRSGIQQLCPRLKTTSRSTFRLGPSPHHPAAPCSSITAIHSKAPVPTWGSSIKVPAGASAATAFVPPPVYPTAAPAVRTTSSYSAVPESAMRMWDSHWDCDDDDQLLYLACDTLERSSSVQAEGGRSSSSGTPPITTFTANKQLPCSRLVRSNSLPETRRWGPFPGGRASGGGASKGGALSMSQSLPGPLSSCSITSGTTASSNRQPACKRSGPHSAEISSKVFVSGQLKAQVKCSAAEIERKKQEALTRRRLRMHNNS